MTEAEQKAAFAAAYPEVFAKAQDLAERHAALMAAIEEASVRIAKLAADYWSKVAFAEISGLRVRGYMSLNVDDLLQSFENLKFEHRVKFELDL